MIVYAFSSITSLVLTNSSQHTVLPTYMCLVHVTDTGNLGMDGYVFWLRSEFSYKHEHVIPDSQDDKQSWMLLTLEKCNYVAEGHICRHCSRCTGMLTSACDDTEPWQTRKIFCRRVACVLSETTW